MKVGEMRNELSNFRKVNLKNKFRRFKLAKSNEQQKKLHFEESSEIASNKSAYEN